MPGRSGGRQMRGATDEWGRQIWRNLAGAKERGSGKKVLNNAVLSYTSTAKQQVLCTRSGGEENWGVLRHRAKRGHGAAASAPTEPSLAAVVDISSLTTVEDCTEVVKHLQLAVGLLKRQIEGLEHENIVLRTNQKKRSVCQNISVKVTAHETEIKRLGCSFVGTRKMFFHHELLLRVQPSSASDDPLCYSSPELMQEGIVADLYEHIPPALHTIMSRPQFKHLFCAAGASWLFSETHKLRCLGSIVFELESVPPATFQRDFDRKSVPQLAGLLKWDPNSPSWPTFPPALYPDGKKNDRLLFVAPALLRLLKAMVNGSSSILATSKKPTPKTNAVIWGMSEVTPGFVALGAVFAQRP
ncbi:hypothetical protein BXZ70DRAFT_906947 [Cristinia sonorae]|uniref:Uncharacterized protein n=1 Tax=Cristinia sonorae TaxID=1940300 RepID=A0A8K0UPW6_9AGAR|nr:hypothetical protein BXZ70DRAFT_906947 [Cristinia sonorae]